MSPPEYLQAVIPKPFTVLGRKLRPLSIGHILTMQWQGLSYCQEEATKATLDDLVSGVLICSMGFREYQEFLQREDLEEALKKMGKGLDLGQTPAKHTLFSQYLAEGLECPDFEIPDNVTNSLLIGSPWLQCLRVCLMTQFHVGSEEAFDYSYRQALWDCLSLRESEGRLVLNTGQADTTDAQLTIETLQALNAGWLEHFAGGTNAT